VIDGAAEVAPIDSYVYCLLQKFRPDLCSQLRVVGRTAPTPIPPLVASHAGFDTLRAAFLEAHEIASIQPLMADLLLERFVRPDSNSYDALRSNFETATQYWKEHPLAANVHPAFLFR
jgi:ABC-type phosphate/phosphonate transport system substrate-binding protein